MSLNSINFKEKFSLFTELWSPKIIAQMNDVHFKIAKIQGEFLWHSHPESDETFIVIEGKMRIEFPGNHIDLDAGEMVVVPKGVMHKPASVEKCHILLIEPAGTVNTGDAGGERTIERVGWI